MKHVFQYRPSAKYILPIWCMCIIKYAGETLLAMYQPNYKTQLYSKQFERIK